MALEYFNRAFVSAYRERNGSTNWSISADDDKERFYLGLLRTAGLVEPMTRNGFRLTTLGAQACARQVDPAAMMGLRRPDPPVAVQNNNFNGPIGAVATGANGTAIGTVNVNDAMHRLVDLQEQLGELSDEMWTILRRLQEVELNQEGLDGLKEAVHDLEVEQFVGKLRGKKLEHVAELLKTAAPAIGQVLVGLTKG